MLVVLPGQGDPGIIEPCALGRARRVRRARRTIWVQLIVIATAIAKIKRWRVVEIPIRGLAVTSSFPFLAHLSLVGRPEFDDRFRSRLVQEVQGDDGHGS